MIQLAERLSSFVGLSATCDGLGVPRRTVYRFRQAKAKPQVAKASPPVRRPSPRALSLQEREQVLETLNSPRFQDQSPRQVYATLLDEHIYLCSFRTMYRILQKEDQVRERRNQLRHPVYTKPELLATDCNQVWSWDITKLRGPTPGTYFYLYVVLDIFSRYVVGWLIATCESTELAVQLISETCDKEKIDRHQLTIHSDRGSVMMSKPVAQLLADLGVIKSHSRPHLSNDNPYSEAQFKTLKYRPDYPGRFGCLQDARAWARAFFEWYNLGHHHSGLALLTPAQVHDGQTDKVLAQRQAVLLEVYRAHPERFVRGVPRPAEPPKVAWINPPKPENEQLAAKSGQNTSARA